MFTDINLFRNDQQKFYEELRELNMAEVDDKDKQIKDINSKFRDTIRKYLPTCLNIINTNFGCQFSLYKVGKDFDASFKVIETNVKKTKEEVETELVALRGTINYESLSEDTKSQIELASEILITYVDDSVNMDISKMEFLERATAKTSSIITNVPKMSQEALSSNEVATTEIQYNPYANEPIKFDDEFQKPDVSSVNEFTNNNINQEPVCNFKTMDAQDNTNFSMNIFYGDGQ